MFCLQTQSDGVGSVSVLVESSEVETPVVEDVVVLQLDCPAVFTASAESTILKLHGNVVLKHNAYAYTSLFLGFSLVNLLL